MLGIFRSFLPSSLSMARSTRPRGAREDAIALIPSDTQTGKSHTAIFASFCFSGHRQGYGNDWDSVKVQ